MRITIRKAQLAVLGIMAAVLVCCGEPKQNNRLFLTKAKELGAIIISQASGGKNLCQMYNTVWEYAKVTDMDFKSAYREMMMDTSGIITQMETNDQMMDRIMNTVKSPPKSMTEIHKKLIELRESYLEFNKFILKLPQISQEKFNSKVDAYIANLNSMKDELDRMIAEAEADLSGWA